LTYFNHDYKADLQEVSFDQQEVRKIFYGSFHKVLIKRGRNVAHDLNPVGKYYAINVYCSKRGVIIQMLCIQIARELANLFDMLKFMIAKN